MDTDLTQYQAAPLVRDARRLLIVVVSEVRFLREGIAEILDRDPSVSAVGVCADLTEVVALSSNLQPDLVLLDMAFPDGTAAIARTRNIAPDLRIVAFAVKEVEEDIISWAQAGVIGYIPSTAAWADLARLVIDIHSGKQPCVARVAAGLLRRIAATASLDNGYNTASPALPLTRRERQTAELISTGHSDKEIARRLNVSLATTKTHVHSLLGKLSVQRRGQVVVRLREYERHPG